MFAVGTKKKKIFADERLERELYVTLKASKSLKTLLAGLVEGTKSFRLMAAQAAASFGGGFPLLLAGGKFPRSLPG